MGRAVARDVAHQHVRARRQSANIRRQVEPEGDERRARTAALERHDGLLERQEGPAHAGHHEHAVDADRHGLAVERHAVHARIGPDEGAGDAQPPAERDDAAELEVVTLHDGVADLHRDGAVLRG